jgi:hypothetical protein
MAVIELRRIAEQAPDMAVELHELTQQLQAKAEELARLEDGENQCFISSK